jgi:hypothetical protein
MKRDLLSGGYIHADETHLDVQTPDKKCENHKAYFWQYSAPGMGVVFDFEINRSKKVARKFSRPRIRRLRKIHRHQGSDPVPAVSPMPGADLSMPSRFTAHSKGEAPYARLERVVALIDNLLAIERKRQSKPSCQAA